MSEVQQYLDCGCALLVGGERVWCPSCLGGGSASKAAPAVVDAKLRIADLERQLAEARSMLKDQRKVLIEAGELLDKDAIIADLERLIESMQPVVEFVDADSSDHCAPDGSVCLCDQCQLVRQYRKARKPK